MTDQEKLLTRLQEYFGRSGEQSCGPVTVCLRDVEPEAIQWLWPDHIPLGKITVLVGDPGVGKSMLTAAIAAQISLGSPWPVGNTECSQGDVVMLCGEDDLSDTVRPRMDAAGADVSRVHAITMVREVSEDGGIEERLFALSRDIEHLGSALKSLPETRAVIIDPVSNYLGEGADSYKDADVRRVLRPLKELAEENNVAMILVGHMNKASQMKALYRMNGSLAFVALARVVYLVTKDKDDSERRLVLPVKVNIAKDSTGMAYAMQSTPENVPYVVWEREPVTVTAEEALAEEPAASRMEREDAIAWLRDALAEGPMDATELRKAAEASGVAWRTLGRAKKDAGVISRKKGFGNGWEWVLLDEGCHQDDPKDASQNCGTLRDNWHSSDSKDANSAKDATSMDGNLRGTLGPQGGYPKGLFEAAAKAVSGLSLSAGDFISRLDPEDYQDIIEHPETARFCAEGWAAK